MAQFWPIGLCNVIYKIINNRLKRVLYIVIFFKQSTFVLVRFISDNAATNCRTRGKVGIMAMKLHEWNGFTPDV